MKGQEFVLDAQLKIVKEQMAKLKNNEGDFNEKTRSGHGTLQQANRENSRQQMMLEGDLKQLNDNNHNNEEIHYDHKLTQDLEKAFDEEAMNRHNLEVKLVTELREKKTT